MASLTSKMFPSLGRINVFGFGLESAGRVTYSTALSVNSTSGNKGFPERSGRSPFGRRTKREPGEPRTQKMPLDQDWTSVYPAAAPFRPNSVPLPVRMGYPVRGGVPPDKKGNLELIKTLFPDYGVALSKHQLLHLDSSHLQIHHLHSSQLELCPEA